MGMTDMTKMMLCGAGQLADGAFCHDTMECNQPNTDTCSPPDLTPKMSNSGPPDVDVGSRSSVRLWITLIVGGARHTDPASDPKTQIQQS